MLEIKLLIFIFKSTDKQLCSSCLSNERPGTCYHNGVGDKFGLY